jgi:hypothetical protein
MRLLEVHTMKLYTFYGDQIPPYAILSHRWLQEGDEVSYQQIRDPSRCRHLPGYHKIELLCNQAMKDGYKYAWIDTCCIDKSSSAELSEAINSMYAWYQRSAVCYAYLTDLHSDSKDLLDSLWWSRAWYVELLSIFSSMNALIGHVQDLAGITCASASPVLRQFVEVARF